MMQYSCPSIYLPTVVSHHHHRHHPSPLHSKLFSSITRQTQSFVSGMVVRYLKRVVSATIILASSLSSVGMPGPMMMTLPPSGDSHLQYALRRSVLAASPMMSVMMIGKKDYYDDDEEEEEDDE